ncbi:MAG: CvpA family protein [Candidatus Schekmanbacteria bacterium]|nr:CvpA family protein [Candidatus Schekmanbacteria bacterium]
MYWLDIIIIAVLVFGFGSGLWRGLVREIVSFITVITAAFAATHYCAWGSRHLIKIFKDERLASLIGFCLIFFGIIAIGILLGRIIKGFLKKSGLSTTDKLLGALFGLLEAIVMIAVLLLVLDRFILSGDDLLKRSKGAPFFLPISRFMADFMPKNVFDALLDDVKSGVEKIKELPKEIKEKGADLKEKVLPPVPKDKPSTAENEKALEEDKGKIGNVIKKSRKK